MLSWFPLSDGYDYRHLDIGWSGEFVLSLLYHAILPVFTIILGSLAGWVLPMRNTMVTTLSEDYVLMAEAKGLPERRAMRSCQA